MARRIRLHPTTELARPRRIRIPTPPSEFFHVHTHSKFSANDALSTVEELVATAASMRQPALGLTDHGNMAGTVQLYQAAKRHNLVPFPGIEAYLKQTHDDKKARRFHVGLLAFTTEGYQDLVRLVSRMHSKQRGNFHHKPHVDFADLAEWSERGLTRGIALTTGCFFGMVQQTLLDQGVEEAEWLIKTLASWFPHTYVELQHHHIDHEGISDDEIVGHLSAIAWESGLPTVITQDAHYTLAADKPVHETLKRLVSWSEDPSEAVFPGDSFHLATEEFVKEHYTPEIWDRGIAGLQDLLNRNVLVIPELERYHYNVPIVTAGDPLEELKLVTTNYLANHLNVRNTQPYWDRLAEEIDVVIATNMAGYLMLNKLICDWMREQGIFYEARGSASGSLICWLLGITQEDVVKEGLRYERFLSKDRTKPPDIDLDVEDSRRGEVISWLSSRFNVCQIGTWAEYSLKDEDGRGSLLVAYLSKLRKQGVDPAYLGTIKNAEDLPPKHRRELYALAKHAPFKSHGTHAGGVVITSNRAEFDRLVPTMLVASSNTTVTQFEMDDVEALGLLKEDILGQTSLTTLRRCNELIGRSVHDGWDWIPLDDKETFRAIRQQKVDGVFQLEGKVTKRGCRELKPKVIRDMTHLMALYRPAPMDTGITEAYIRRRAKWEQVPDRHPILNKHLKESYGLPILQDQVISILREIGFTPEHLTSFLKAVKASNAEIGDAAGVIAGYQEMFGDLATAAGFDQADLRFTWEAIEGFSKYGFNKAHATTYGKRAYRMAYLKTHYPLEFHTALLQTWAGTVKERDYILATQEAGIPMLGPDVNISGATWSIDRKRGAIRKGLVSIKYIGEKCAEEIARHAPYQDLDELIERCEPRAVTGGKKFVSHGELNGNLEILRQAKALRSLGIT
jgi:DNA polymerase III subunit alpha